MGYAEGQKSVELESLGLEQGNDDVKSAAPQRSGSSAFHQLVVNVCFVSLLLVGTVCIGYGSYMLGYSRGHHAGHTDYIVTIQEEDFPEPTQDTLAALSDICPTLDKNQCLSHTGCGYCAWNSEIHGEQGEQVVRGGAACVPGDTYGPFDAEQCCSHWLAFSEKNYDTCWNERRLHW